jgi:Helix-turn-helix domain
LTAGIEIDSEFSLEDDARKVNHKTLEVMQVRVVKRVQKNESPEALAQVLGLNRSIAYGWLARYRRGGWDGLKAKPLGLDPTVVSPAAKSTSDHETGLNYRQGASHRLGPDQAIRSPMAIRC